MTREELQEFIQELSFNDNAKVVLLVGRTSTGEYQIVQVDDDGKIVTM